MHILIAPLNWGLGHAARCIPLIVRYLREGHEVTLAGDGDALLLLRRHFPNLPYRALVPLRLRYSGGNSQVGAMALALPKLLIWALRDHHALDTLLRNETFDMVLSDNRFGCFSRRTRCVYLTHQLHIMLPDGWRWLEPVPERLHLRIARRYSEVWVPDFADSIGLSDHTSLSGALSHNVLPAWHDRVRYIGPLSRFEQVGSAQDSTAQECSTQDAFQVVAVLSGLEPQRTLLEQALIREWLGREETVLIVRGTLTAPPTTTHKRNITLVPYMGDRDLAAALRSARTVIARSGYSTIMDLHALGVLHKAKLIPTPGQPEQEYLALYIANKLNNTI